MAPRRGKGKPQERQEVAEKALALEAAIVRIRGVVSARVSCGPSDEVVAIDVLVKGAGSKRIIRDIESACTAHLGHRLPADALGVTRVPGAAARPKTAPVAAPVASSEELQPAEGRQSPTGSDARSPEAGTQARAPKRYRVISRPGAASRAVRMAARVPARPGLGDEDGMEDARFGPRIGMRRVGISVYPDRLHASVELICAGRAFAGECEGLASEENRFGVPVGAAMQALDRAFGGLVGISVDDVQVCRLSGTKTAVVLATVGSPWGDVPSTGASYATRSEEEAVIRALLHAVNRCVTLTYGGDST